MRKIDFELERANYERDGYLVIRGFLDSMEIQEVHHALQKIISGKISSMAPKHVVYEHKENAKTLKQLQDLHQYSSFFKDILFKSEFEMMARMLLKDNAIGRTVEYFNKPARIGKATPPHQDAYYFMLNPPDAITMWLALEDVDEENGCIRYVRGSHLGPMRSHARTQTLGFSQGIIDYGTESDVQNEVAIEAKAGDLLIHHAMTIHRADGNVSESRSRRALGFIYFSASAREDKEAKAAYEKILEKERS